MYSDPCSEVSTKKYIFENNTVETTTNYSQQPSANIFSKKFTKLILRTSVRPGDENTQNEIISARESFRNGHALHGDFDTVRTENRRSKTYFVGNSGTIPWVFTKAIYWIIALLGLSIVHRLFIYIYIGHVSYKVKKCVFTPESTQSHDPVEDTSSPPPPYTTVMAMPPTPPPDYDTVCPLGENTTNEYEMTPLK